MEYLNSSRPEDAVRAVLFDFDGIISTLRCRWERKVDFIGGEAEGACAGGETQRDFHFAVADNGDGGAG